MDKIAQKGNYRLSYVDGYVSVVKTVTELSNKGKVLGQHDVVIARLPFNYMSIRTRDYDTLQSKQVLAQGVDLALKLQTPTHPAVTRGRVTQYTILLGDERYAIIDYDTDKLNNTAYYYLSLKGYTSEGV